jgi:hypothetical protein
VVVRLNAGIHTVCDTLNPEVSPPTVALLHPEAVWLGVARPGLLLLRMRLLGPGIIDVSSVGWYLGLTLRFTLHFPLGRELRPNGR